MLKWKAAIIGEMNRRHGVPKSLYLCFFSNDN
jgi:hypothetical protein